MKAEINGFEVKGTVEEIRQLITSQITERKKRKSGRARKGRRRWSSREVSDLRRMLSDKKTPKQIARKLGRTKAAILHMIWRINKRR